jgi:hypothetical protein
MLRLSRPVAVTRASKVCYCESCQWNTKRHRERERYYHGSSPSSGLAQSNKPHQPYECSAGTSTMLHEVRLNHCDCTRIQCTHVPRKKSMSPFLQQVTTGLTHSSKTLHACISSFVRLRHYSTKVTAQVAGIECQRVHILGLLQNYCANVLSTQKSIRS